MPKITQPALFIAGTNDAVITGSIGQRALDEMDNVVPHLRKVLIDGAGHWIQQERPDERERRADRFRARASQRMMPVVPIARQRRA